MVLLGILSYIMIKYRMINIVLYTILPHAIVSCDIAIFNIVLYDAVPETFYFFPIFRAFTCALCSALFAFTVHKPLSAPLTVHSQSVHFVFTVRSAFTYCRANFHFGPEGIALLCLQKTK